MMSKRALTNISNVNNKNAINAGKPVKRTLELSPNKDILMKKKNKSLNAKKDEQIIKSDDENHSNNTNKSHQLLSDPTRSIELKVKAIAIGSKSNKLSQKKGENINVFEKSESLKSSEAKLKGFWDPLADYCPPKAIPDSVEDYDKTQLKNIESEPHYAHDVFEYYKIKELTNTTKKYMESQPELSKGMRSVLVDWMVEVQESFELNHETLYLSVKLIDQYLMREKITKSQFQLVGATAILIAAKFDERIPPAIEDFLYICDDAYDRRDVVLMEMKILHKLDFYLCFPLSYRFLRRYARCAKLSMETLTLARYILEMSLMDYEMIEERDSFVAAAALLLAMKMKGQTEWTETLEFYSGYKEDALLPLMYSLNDMISAHSKTKTIKTKYSHKIFYEVAKTSPLPAIKSN